MTTKTENTKDPLSLLIVENSSEPASPSNEASADGYMHALSPSTSTEQVAVDILLAAVGTSTTNLVMLLNAEPTEQMPIVNSEACVGSPSRVKVPESITADPLAALKAVLRGNALWLFQNPSSTSS